jgi:phosphopantothenoylcysteine decarboxylase/phosphopantothenate--cysteine ligase
MNVRMWLHPATQRNLATLKADGVLFVGPDDGAMACGEFGPGRMAEPEQIFAAITAALNGPAERSLHGKRALVTAGPTVEPIDPVRFLSNRSSGKQGYAIAENLAALGAEVTLVSGPTALAAPPGVTRVDVETAAEMLAACQAALPFDVAVMVAAVADWRPSNPAARKLKKLRGAPDPIGLTENPDILATLSKAGPTRPRLVIGFAAETDDLDRNSQAKLARKGCDWVVANDVSQEGVMGGAENAVSILTRDGIERWEKADKRVVAMRLAAKIAKALQ